MILVCAATQIGRGAIMGDAVIQLMRTHAYELDNEQEERAHHAVGPVVCSHVAGLVAVAVNVGHHREQHRGAVDHLGVAQNGQGSHGVVVVAGIAIAAPSIEFSVSACGDVASHG